MQYTLYPLVRRVCLLSVTFVSWRRATPMPICRSPFAAASNPNFRPLRMFHVAIGTVLLPSGLEGGLGMLDGDAAAHGAPTAKKQY